VKDITKTMVCEAAEEMRALHLKYDEGIFNCGVSNDAAWQ